MFADIPIISIIILLPLIGSIITMSLGRRDSYAKWIAAAF